MDIKREA